MQSFTPTPSVRFMDALAWRKPCRSFVFLCFLALFCLSLTQAKENTSPTNQDTPQLDLPRSKLQLGMYRIDIQVASTPEQQQKGLMYRRDLPENEGMLFDFSNSAGRCFWMKNTPIALSAAFIRSDGSIINIADMQPLSEKTHCSAEPARYVLEMRKGWFKKRGIGAGSKISPAAN